MSRPVANLLYWFFSHFENGLKLQLVTVNYFIHVAISTLFYHYGIKFSNSKKYSLLLAVSAFLTPAFWAADMVNSPSFTLDGLAAFFCLIALFSLKSKYAWISFILLTLAVFTKESALPIVAAVAAYSIFTRDKRTAFAAFIILLIYATVRILAFGKLSSGLYPFEGLNSISSILFRFVSSFLKLPITYTSSEDIKNLILEGKVSASLIFVLANITFWFIFLISIFQIDTQGFKRIFKKNHDSLPNTYHYYFLTLICISFSILFFILINGSVRFSYVFYIFLLAGLTIQIEYSIRKYLLIGILIVSSTIVFIYSINKIYKAHDSYVLLYDASTKLTDLMKSLSPDKPVYVINDFVSFFSTEQNVANYAGAAGEYLRGSSLYLIGCNQADIFSISQQISVETNTKSITTHIPECASFGFEAGNNLKILSNLSGNQLYRNESIHYLFPDIQLGKERKSDKIKINGFGNTMVTTIKDSAIIYFDFSNRKWIYLP